MTRPARRSKKAARIAIRAAAACAVTAGAAGAAALVSHPAPVTRTSAGPQPPPLAGSLGTLIPRSTGLGGAPAVRSLLLPDEAARHPGARRIGSAGRPIRPAPDHARATGTDAGITAGSGRSDSPAFGVTYVRQGISLSAVHPRAGGSYAFKRGATYTGTLTITADNVTIGAYGSGPYPVFSRHTEGNDITVSGDAVRISHIRLTGHGYQQVPGCGSARTAGYEVGIDIRGSYDTVDSVRAYGSLYAGVLVESAGSYATISDSVFNGVNALNPANFGSGAFGVLLWGDHNTLDRDILANQSTCSPRYGRDGSGVEVYHGSHNMIKHSTGWNDVDFTELGGRGATGNVYLDNTYAGPGEFLVTRGSDDSADGPVQSTVLIGNVARGAVVSYDWRPGEGPLLIMRDNHVSRLSQDGGFVNKGGTIIGF